MTATVLVVLAIAAAAMFPFLAEALRRPIDGDTRTRAPGAFATLSMGRTHFQWRGKRQGPVAVCVHGLTTPSFVFDAIAPGLAAQGYRVLTYDLFGRGYSDRTTAPQSGAFHCAQLEELLAQEGIEDIALIIGYSMGGAIATAFASGRPARVKSVILLASAGLSRPAGPMVWRPFLLPGVADWYVRVLGGLIFRRTLRRTRENAPAVPGIGKRQAEETRKRGFMPAVLSSQRYFLRSDQRSEHAVLHDHFVPVQAIWGGSDPVIPLRSKTILAAVNPDAHQIVIDGAGHGLPYTHPSEILAAIEEFR